MAINKKPLAGLEGALALYREGSQVDVLWEDTGTAVQLVNPKNINLLGQNVLNLSQNILSDTQATTKKYVDDAIRNITFPTDPNWNAGGSALKNLSMGIYRMSQSLAPVGATDLTNKQYVDTAIDSIIPPDYNDPNWSAAGTALRQLSMGTNKLISLGAPTASTDATNKGYVDDRTPFGTSGTSSKNLSMGSTYRITQSSAPTANGHLTNKQYVDAAIAGVTPPAYQDPNWNSSGNAIRALTMGTFQLTKSAAPTTANHVTNKTYVDGRTPFGTTGTATRNIAMGTYKITQSTAPTATTDLTNKTYVDSFWHFQGTAGAANAYVRPNRNGTTTANWELRYIKDPTVAHAAATKGYVDGLIANISFASRTLSRTLSNGGIILNGATKDTIYFTTNIVCTMSVPIGSNRTQDMYTRGLTVQKGTSIFVGTSDQQTGELGGVFNVAYRDDGIIAINPLTVGFGVVSTTATSYVVRESNLAIE